MLSLAGWLGTSWGCLVLLDLDGYSSTRDAPDAGANGGPACMLGCPRSDPAPGGDTTCSLGEVCAERADAAAGASGALPDLGAGRGGVTALGGSGGSGGSEASNGSGGASAAAGGSAAVAGSGGAGASGGNASSGGAASTTVQLLSNAGFESGSEPWVSFTTGQDPLVYDATQAGYEGVPAHGGQRLGWLGGVADETNRLSQTVSLPVQATRLTFAGSLRVQIFEQHDIIDFLRVSLTVAGQRLPLLEFDNGDASSDWLDMTTAVDVSAFAGQAITLELESQIGMGPGTNFFVDDLALIPE
jgi:hypothetical protein